MKIRSEIELQNFLDKSCSLRKRELTTLKFLLMSMKRDHEKKAFMRASTTIIYAHWEGFIKTSSMAYLDYISRLSINLSDLTHNFIAIALKERIATTGRSKRTSSHLDLINDLLINLNQSSISPDTIDTGSNLNSEILQDIMTSIGLDFNSYWELKCSFIDRELVDNRNAIAHGELKEINEDTFNDLHDFVVEAMEKFKTDIENAAALKKYQKTS